MAYKFFQIPVRCSESIEVELNAFLKSHRATEIDRRWVDVGANSYWAISIEYWDGEPIGARATTTGHVASAANTN